MITAHNLQGGGFAGPIWLLNPKYRSIEGQDCIPSIFALPGSADLAVLVTPPETIPELVGQLGAKARAPRWWPPIARTRAGLDLAVPPEISTHLLGFPRSERLHPEAYPAQPNPTAARRRIVVGCEPQPPRRTEKASCATLPRVFWSACC